MQQLGARLSEHGARFLVPRPSELPPVAAMWQVAGAHQADVLNQHLARVSTLPLEQLESMLSSTQDKVVLIAAIAHVTVASRCSRAPTRSRWAASISRRVVSTAKAPRIIRELETELTAATRKAEFRNPDHPDYRDFFKRRWREMACQLEELKHEPRGHQHAIHMSNTPTSSAPSRASFTTLAGAPPAIARAPPSTSARASGRSSPSC